MTVYINILQKKKHLKHKEVTKSEKKDLEILARGSRHTIEAESHFLLTAHFQRTLNYSHNTQQRYVSGESQKI